MAMQDVAVIDNHPDKDNWITNKSGVPVSVACQDLFGSSAFGLEPGETKEISFDITANVYPLGQYAYDDLKYTLGRQEKWEVRSEEGQLVMRKLAASEAPAAAAEETAAATPATAADWYADPTSRHQFRYWDGASWTDNVADNGSASVDPLQGPGVSRATTPATAVAADQKASPEFLEFFAKEFGLTRVGGGWSFTGPSADALAQVANATLCLDVLRKLQVQGQPFQHVAIVAGPKAFLVLDTKPPRGLPTSLDATGIADLITAMIKASGAQAAEYEGVWLLKLV